MIGSTNVRKLKKGELLFGDGSDGDLVVPANTTMEWDVKEDIGRIYKQYNTLTLEEGSTLKPKHRCNGAIILVKGDCIIRGHLSMDGCAPLLNDYENETLNDRHVKLAGALKGGNGGKGGAGYWIKATNQFSAPTDADRISNFGGVGGNGHRLGGGFGGGGGGGERYNSSFSSAMPEYEYKGGDSEPRPSFGITWPCTTNGAYGAGGGSLYQATEYSYGIAKGGASPGGGGASHRNWSRFIEDDQGDKFPGLPGKAYGGGALWLYVGGNVLIDETGFITSNGGLGGALSPISATDNRTEFKNASVFGGCGGSGGGGIVFILYGKNYSNRGEGVAADGGGSVTMNSNIFFDMGVSKPYSEVCPLGVGTAGSLGTVKILHIGQLEDIVT